jgi:hypothetical protein
MSAKESQKRYHRRLIYISPGKVLAAREIVKFIPEESVSPGGDKGEYQKKERCAIWEGKQFKRKFTDLPAIHVFKSPVSSCLAHSELLVHFVAPDY